MIIRSSVFLYLTAAILLAAYPGSAQELPFFPQGTYDPAVPTPESVLGFPVGRRPARYDEVVRYITTLAEQSNRVKLFEMGATAEGRKTYYCVISAPEQIARLEEVRLNNLHLADSRSLGEDDVRRLVEANPLVVWAGYAIHGNEISSVDASLQILYQLAAGTDSVTLLILRETCVCIDPMQNPDGRERFLAQMQQWNGPILNPDAQSLHHTGTWPYGRGNHYLFDLNRDWFVLTNPEMQQRVQAVVRWLPQVMIDSHEMGSSDTYLFSPPRQPLNPNISPVPHAWWSRFAADQAKAFDRYGWSYYTREWNDDWYPGYGASWPLYVGAVGILYEQAGVQGTLVKRPDGSVLTYREAVHHHVTSSLANFTTAARHRRELLADFAADRRRGAPAEPGGPRAFYLVPGNNQSRADRLVDRLLMSGIEVGRTEKEITVSSLVSPTDETRRAKKLPRGTYCVSLNQPMGRLAKALLEFDPRMNTQVLDDERKSLEKKKDSKMYDVTAWSLPLAFDVEGYWTPDVPPSEIPLLTALTRPDGRVENPDASYGYLMRCQDDREVEALCMLLCQGVRARAAQEPFMIAGQAYERGSILFRKNENGPGLLPLLDAVAESAGVMIRGVGTALATSGVDLGGNDLVLLKEPRVALLAGQEISTTNFGWIWQLLDERMKMRVTLLSPARIGSADLEKYNVMILPSGSSASLSRLLGKSGIQKIRTWLEMGGTLIAEGEGAEFVADTASGLSAVRLRQQALKDLPLYAMAVDLERKAGTPGIDSVSLWGKKKIPPDSLVATKTVSQDEKLLALQDERGRRFAPQGAILQVTLDPEHWLAFGMKPSVPVMVASSSAFLSREPVQTPARFSDAEHLRLSGLLWPEAKQRLALTAYATREGKGRGQIILFEGEPVFRGGFRGSERLFLNAILLGPGFGTAREVDW